MFYKHHCSYLLFYCYVVHIMISDISYLICILFVHLSSIIVENSKDRALIIPEILEFIELHTYMFGLVYILKLWTLPKLTTNQATQNHNRTLAHWPCPCLTYLTSTLHFLPYHSLNLPYPTQPYLTLPHPTLSYPT